VATEVLSVREPNITHVKLLQLDSSNKVLIAICKLYLIDSEPGQSTNYDNSSNSQQSDSQEQQCAAGSSEPQQTQQIAIVNMLNGECLHEILFNGIVLEMKSNNDLLCVNSWNRIDAFDLSTFEHRFSLNSCFSQISKSSGMSTNPFSLGNRWLAFADKKFHVILSSQGGVSMDIEQSYAATVLNTAKVRMRNNKKSMSLTAFIIKNQINQLRNQ